MKPTTPVIPPLSIVQLKSEAPDWADQKGQIFRVGYYSRQDGLNCVWLVDDSGDYIQTADQQCIQEDFDVLQFGEEDDLFGVNRPRIGTRQVSHTSPVDPL